MSKIKVLVYYRLATLFCYHIPSVQLLFKQLPYLAHDNGIFLGKTTLLPLNIRSGSIMLSDFQKSYKNLE